MLSQLMQASSFGSGLSLELAVSSRKVWFVFRCSFFEDDKASFGLCRSNKPSIRYIEGFATSLKSGTIPCCHDVVVQDAFAAGFELPCSEAVILEAAYAVLSLWCGSRQGAIDRVLTDESKAIIRLC